MSVRVSNWHALLFILQICGLCVCFVVAVQFMADYAGCSKIIFGQ